MRNSMRWLLAVAMLATGVASAAVADDDAKDTAKGNAKMAKRVTEATAVYQELVTAADKGVPKELLEGCKCVAVLPNVMTAAIGYGGRHGNGVMSCRTANGWTAPAFVSITGGSFGLQLGAQSTDLVLFFMNDRGARSLVNGTRITLGGKASVAAGPWGRSGEAATNVELKSEIYSYARSKGLFAGLSVEGARLSPNKDDITDYYGRGVTYNELLFGKGVSPVPPEADGFRKALP